MDYQCTFCPTPKPEGRMLIAAPDGAAYICLPCVTLAVHIMGDLIREYREERATPPEERKP